MERPTCILLGHGVWVLMSMLYTLVKNRAGFGNHLLHWLLNVQAEFGNEVVDSEINVFSCAIFLSLASFRRLLLGFLSDLNSTMLHILFHLHAGRSSDASARRS